MWLLLACLLVVPLTTCILQLFDINIIRLPRHWKKTSRIIIPIIAWIALSIIALFAYSSIMESRRLNWSSLNEGRVSPGAPLGRGPLDGKFLAIGEVWYSFDSEEDVIFREGDDALLSLRIEDGDLLISAKIRNSDGSLAANIVDNEWQVMPGQHWDRNFTDDVLEVQNPEGDVVLQIAHFDEVISLQAIIRTRSGWSYGFGSKMIGDKSASGFVKWRSDDDALLVIEPICEYPSGQHQGECPGIKRLREMAQIGKSRSIRLSISSSVDLKGPEPTYKLGSKPDITPSYSRLDPK